MSFFIPITLFACVSKDRFNDLEKQYLDLKTKNQEWEQQVQDLNDQITQSKTENEQCNTQLAAQKEREDAKIRYLSQQLSDSQQKYYNLIGQKAPHWDCGQYTRRLKNGLEYVRAINGGGSESNWEDTQHQITEEVNEALGNQ